MLGMFRNQIEYGKIFFARASIQNLDCSQYFFLTKFFLSFKIIHFRLFSFKYTYIVIHIKKSTCMKLLCPLTAGGWRPSEFKFFFTPSLKFVRMIDDHILFRSTQVLTVLFCPWALKFSNILMYHPSPWTLAGNTSVHTFSFYKLQSADPIILKYYKLSLSQIVFYVRRVW